MKIYETNSGELLYEVAELGEEYGEALHLDLTLDYYHGGDGIDVTRDELQHIREAHFRRLKRKETI